MKAASRLAGFCVATFVLGLLAGCATKPTTMPMPPLPDLPMAFHGGPTAPKYQLNLPPRKAYFPWMVVGEFYPPGAHAIEPPDYRAPHLVDTSSAWFPSTDECISGDGERTLYHLANASGDAMDYVVYLKYNKANYVRPVFEIRKALEVLWSPDANCAAITILTGSNYADVVVFAVPERKLSATISAPEALRGYLPWYLAEAPQFIMALGWTSDGKLVLRARGAEPAPPHRLFGYELLVDPDRLPNAGAVRFLRGFDNAPNPDANSNKAVASRPSRVVH